MAFPNAIIDLKLLRNNVFHAEEIREGEYRAPPPREARSNGLVIEEDKNLLVHHIPFYHRSIHQRQLLVLRILVICLQSL